MTTTHDVLVVGAGYIGAIIAAHLANMGARVAVVDARAVGEGATNRAIGLATPCLLPEFLNQTSNGLESLTHIADQHGVIPVICSTLHVASRASGSDALRQQCAALQKLDHSDRFNWETNPDTVPHGYGGGIWVAHSMLLNVNYLTVRLLQHPNISVFPGIEITRIQPERGVMHALAEGYTLRADQVILATNAYGGSLSPYLSESVHFARGITWTSHPLDEAAYDADLFSVPLIVDGGRLLVARGNDSRLRISAWIFDDRTGYAEADPAALVRQFIDQQAPDLANKTERWQSGVSTYTNDSAPLVGQLPVDGRVFYATAAGLYGLTWGPIIAEQIAEMVSPS